MNYLLDTCTVSYFFKKFPSVVKNFKKVRPEQIHISSITVMEIEYGLRLHHEREKQLRPIWNSLLKFSQVISYSDQCATATASIRASFKNAGLPVCPYDVLIAGTAVAHKLVVVTSNLNEFKRIPDIIIEDWRY